MSWESLWGAFLIAALAAFAGLAVVVSWRGVADLRVLFERISEPRGGDSEAAEGDQAGAARRDESGDD